MEDLEGVRVDDVQRLKEMGIDGREVAMKGAKAFLKQVFVDRFFHADPHPGNFSVLPDGRLALVDFGMVGRLDSELMEEIANVLLAGLLGLWLIVGIVRSGRLSLRLKV